ncbi:hypothetical protein GYMLUDRAFT_44010 [Collybiopsis luxurians FD-317 M1]|uniref:Uncharacterized protein n=1 Tax=Collybiopsis luxurians FD-317 M1 TaxID=944289 RepID=A0A0D0BWP3_9AGAR|nr:hypothetical protein GYMLUDRAFT_44010 [Collybiopsis luxurians FD-317 M1]
MPRYVKGYAVDRVKVANFLEDPNDGIDNARINHFITETIDFVRGKSIITGNFHALSVGIPLGSMDKQKMAHVISSGLDVFSRNPDELQKKVQEHPSYVKELAEIICSGEGQEIFEICDWDDPLVSLGDTKLTLASYLGLC